MLKSLADFVGQIPMPMASHYQVAVYAIAEQAVDIILNEDFRKPS